MRYILLGIFCSLVMCSSAFARIFTLSGRWQCHLVEHRQYLCEFRHGDFRLQLIPRYLEDHVDIRIIDGGYFHETYGRPAGDETCVHGMFMAWAVQLYPYSMSYAPYKISDMGHGICLYDIAARKDVDDLSSNILDNFEYIYPNSIEYISEYIKRSYQISIETYNYHGDFSSEVFFIPERNKNYLINGLSYWRRHRFEAKWLARKHPIERHPWQCGWQKDGRLMCDVTAKDMHIMFYPKPDGRNVDVYLMTTLSSCSDNKIDMGFAHEEAYFAANERWYMPLYTSRADARPEKGLGGKWGCGYKLIPGQAFPEKTAAIDALSWNIMQYDVIYGEPHDEEPLWSTAIELTDKAGLVHELQYWKRKNAGTEQTDVKRTGAEQGDVKAVGQKIH